MVTQKQVRKSRAFSVIRFIKGIQLDREQSQIGYFLWLKRPIFLLACICKEKHIFLANNKCLHQIKLPITLHTCAAHLFTSNHLIQVSWIRPSCKRNQWYCRAGIRTRIIPWWIRIKLFFVCKFIYYAIYEKLYFVNLKKKNEKKVTIVTV